MANERLSDAKDTTPPAQVEQDAPTEPTERNKATQDSTTTEQVEADEAIEDRFQATDN
jgi:hypothetical protein